MIPEEIISKIGSRNVSFYITCRYMHYFIHVLYKKQIVDWKSNKLIACLYNKNIIINNIIVVQPKPLSIDLNDYYQRHIYKIKELDIVTTLPTHLTYLAFDDSFDQPIDLSMLKQLKTVEFGKHYNQPLNLPQFLDTLRFSFSSKYDLPLNLPQQLKSLVLGSKFNQSIKLTQFPDTLEHLVFGSKFNKPITNLPKNLKTLHVGYSFDRIIIQLPSSLTMLFLGTSFNRPIDHLVLPNLKFIKYGPKYNHPLFLPDSLEKLALTNDIPITQFPPHIKYLYLPSFYTHLLKMEDLPPSLKMIQVGLNKINVNRYRY